MDQATALAKFLAETDYRALPGETLQAGQRGLLDCLGTAIGGANSDAARMALELIEESGGKPQATLLATANGLLCGTRLYSTARPRTRWITMTR